MLSLLWFRRDLRLQDNPALAFAAATGPVLPLFVLDPAEWSHPSASARHWAFVAESLAELQAGLAALGQPLVIAHGATREVIARLHARRRFRQIVTGREPAGRAGARQESVAAWARDKGVALVELDPAAPGMPHPAALPHVTDAATALPAARALGLSPDPCPGRQTGGRAAGLALLESFMDGRVRDHPRAAASPLAAERAASRLSPHLAWGTLSEREVRAAAAACAVPARAGLRAFGEKLDARARLLDRDQAPPPDRPAGGSAGLRAWAAGETGLPFADACMRYLRATGWLPDGLRALVASVALHRLRLDRGEVATQLARLFTDHDPALLAPRLRAIAEDAPGAHLHPVRQGLRQDPEGRFLRRWLPELAMVPAPFLHRPWLWAEGRRHLAARYPEPLADPETAMDPAGRRQMALPIRP